MSAAVLVANVRGFGRLLDEHGPEHAAHIIERFATITEEVADRAGGQLIHVWADEAFVRFRTPQQAVRAAVEAHRRYDEVMLPGGRSLGVGIGIAVGEMTWVLTGYVGRPVSLATRLCALARPRQTLVDAALRDLFPQVNGVRFHDSDPVPRPWYNGPTRVAEVTAH
jgi:class 3 adenylate cyclase